MSSNSLVDALKEVAHSDHAILTEAIHKSPYETGARREQGQASIVLRPATNEEMSAMVAICVQMNVEVVPQSANTGVVWPSRRSTVPRSAWRRSVHSSSR